MQAGETGLARSPAPGGLTENSRPRPAPLEPRGLPAGWDRDRGAALGQLFHNLNFPHHGPGCGGEAGPGGAGAPGVRGCGGSSGAPRPPPGDALRSGPDTHAAPGSVPVGHPEVKGQTDEAIFPPHECN